MRLGLCPKEHENRCHKHASACHPELDFCQFFGPSFDNPRLAPGAKIYRPSGAIFRTAESGALTAGIVPNKGAVHAWQARREPLFCVAATALNAPQAGPLNKITGTSPCADEIDDDRPSIVIIRDRVQVTEAARTGRGLGGDRLVLDQVPIRRDFRDRWPDGLRQGRRGLGIGDGRCRLFPCCFSLGGWRACATLFAATAASATRLDGLFCHLVGLGLGRPRYAHLVRVGLGFPCPGPWALPLVRLGALREPVPSQTTGLGHTHGTQPFPR
jgi:hypothetical protein